MFLRFMNKLFIDDEFLSDIKESHLNLTTIDDAIAGFISHIAQNHIKKSSRPCIKDPDIVYFIEYLHELFPNAKFVYMIRDGRSVAKSMIKILNQTDHNQKKLYKSYLLTWNRFNLIASNQCIKIGNKYCRILKYEYLLSSTESSLKNLMSFLNIEWTDEFLHHEKYIGNKVVVSNTEWSSNQIKQKISDYLNSTKLSEKNNALKNYDDKAFIQKLIMFQKFNYV